MIYFMCFGQYQERELLGRNGARRTVILEQLDNLVHEPNVRVPQLLRLANLVRVAAALLDEVLDIEHLEIQPSIGKGKENKDWKSRSEIYMHAFDSKSAMVGCAVSGPWKTPRSWMVGQAGEAGVRPPYLLLCTDA